MTYLAIGGGLVALLLLGVVWALRRRSARGRIDDAPAAARAAEAALAGFVAVNAVVGTDWKGALVVGEGGRVAAVKPRGRRLAVREVPWAAVVATPGGIVVESGERRFGRVPLTGVDALDVRRLAPDGVAWRRAAP